jgi:hypothetical protein
VLNEQMAMANKTIYGSATSYDVDIVAVQVWLESSMACDSPPLPSPSSPPNITFSSVKYLDQKSWEIPELRRR